VNVMGIPAHIEAEEERRTRRRALIRAYHPDRGGDPAEFMRLLDEFDQRGPLRQTYAEMKFVRRRRWWQRVWSVPLLRRTPRGPRRVV